MDAMIIGMLVRQLPGHIAPIANVRALVVIHGSPIGTSGLMRGICLSTAATCAGPEAP